MRDRSISRISILSWASFKLSVHESQHHFLCRGQFHSHLYLAKLMLGAKREIEAEDNIWIRTRGIRVQYDFYLGCQKLV